MKTIDGNSRPLLQNSYIDLEAKVKLRIATIKGPVFKTDVNKDLLWDSYLDLWSEEDRQTYNCHCCRSFVKDYGGLVQINEDGSLSSLLWGDEAPILRDMVKSAKVTGVHNWTNVVWGRPEFGGWSHLHGVARAYRYRNLMHNAGQMNAEYLQDFIMVQKALAEFPIEVVRTAKRILESDSVYRAEKAVSVANWFLRLHENRNRNLIWLEIAEAPIGYAHIRSSMIGTLLEDIKNGLSFEVVSRRWKEKMHPLQYQRPTAPPKIGAINRAEKIVEEMGLASALRRRFARQEDILSTFWKSPSLIREQIEKSGGVFDHLKQEVGRAIPEIILPNKNITWDKFQATILPSAIKIEIEVPSYGGFYGLLTASDPESKPILQWDGLEGMPRNPVSWFFYHGGSSAVKWGFTPGFMSVESIFPLPAHWQMEDRFKHFGKQVFFSISEGRWKQIGRLDSHNCLFPETLKSELHEVRSVIEAHSKKSPIEESESGNANGLAFADSKQPVTLRVHTSEGKALYTIDRMD